MQLRHDAQTVTTQIHRLQFGDVGALIHHRAGLRLYKAAHHAHKRAALGVCGQSRVRVVDDEQCVGVTHVAGEFHAVEYVDFAFGAGNGDFVQRKGRVGLEQDVIRAAAHEHAIDARGERHGRFGGLGRRRCVFDQFVFAARFSQVQRLVDAVRIALGRCGGGVCGSQSVRFCLAEFCARVVLGGGV